MNYEQALDFIHSRDKFGMDLGLDRIAKLLDMLGNPHQKLKFIHVAGTNGKGSTTAMIASVLTNAGYKTGMYTSPFVERFNERIQIDFENITDEKLAYYTEIVKKQVEILDKQKLFSAVTEFEVVTAVAFCCYQAEKCDYVVLEVGLGGRLDATNVIACPMVAVIASISYDHTSILGNTLTEIAGEKCGIIKQNCKVVLYPKQEQEIFDKVASVVKSKNATLVIPEKKDVRITKADIDGVEFDYHGLNVFSPLTGAHQAYNAITAIEALKALDIGLTDSEIEQGIAKTKFIGRLQIINKNPNVIIDAGHNPDGVDTLGRFIERNINQGRLFVVMGMLADKDYEYCIKRIASLADTYCAVTPVSLRALSCEDNAAVAKKYCKNVNAYDMVEQAIDSVFDLIEPLDTLVVCGSLYMIGGASIYIRENKLN